MPGVPAAFTELNDDILLSVCRYLKVLDILHLTQTCRTLYDFGNLNHLWAHGPIQEMDLPVHFPGSVSWIDLPSGSLRKAVIRSIHNDRRWRFASAPFQSLIRSPFAHDRDNAVKDLQFLPGGDWLVSTERRERDTEVCLWDLRNLLQISRHSTIRLPVVLPIRVIKANVIDEENVIVLTINSKFRVDVQGSLFAYRINLDEAPRAELTEPNIVVRCASSVGIICHDSNASLIVGLSRTRNELLSIFFVNLKTGAIHHFTTDFVRDNDIRIKVHDIRIYRNHFAVLLREREGHIQTMGVRVYAIPPEVLNGVWQSRNSNPIYADLIVPSLSGRNVPVNELQPPISKRKTYWDTENRSIELLSRGGPRNESKASISLLLLPASRGDDPWLLTFTFFLPSSLPQPNMLPYQPHHSSSPGTKDDKQVTPTPLGISQRPSSAVQLCDNGQAIWLDIDAMNDNVCELKRVSPPIVSPYKAKGVVSNVELPPTLLAQEIAASSMDATRGRVCLAMVQGRSEGGTYRRESTLCILDLWAEQT